MNPIPSATYASRRRLVFFATLPLLGFVGWGVYHTFAVLAAFDGHGNHLALAWAVSFLLLWWVPLAWKEKPYTTTPRQQQQLDELTVAVQVPVYNEDEAALKLCLQSLFEQTRRPDRIHVVDDGSLDKRTGSPITYDTVRAWFSEHARTYGIEATWTRTINRGKRHAQMEVLADDPADIFITLDSDSVLDRKAIREGLKPFADPKVKSVAGMVVVLNSRDNLLTFMTSMLYLPFTRGFRSAQSVLKRVMVNSGTLAFYRGEVIRKYADAYPNETFRGRPMQMNDDSLMTLYGLLDGDTVHQPSAICFTLVPVSVRHYLNQQFRWMRGTFVRTFWWFRYLPITSVAWWMPVMEIAQLILSIAIPVALLTDASQRHNLTALLVSTTIVGLGVNWIIALRFFCMDRSDESHWYRLALFLTAPITGIWRLLILRPMYFYAMFTCWKVGKWGTRDTVEVGMAQA
ncbi:glycosyltransferase [Streptomyces sp. SID1328]|uniref:glycosyltransferase family 2 protein n=2 Tax=Streptomyces TaxID=1883 RepID=UPI0013705D66|nr:glycosyltransferase [Streptomyces sp. SID1328]MYV40787.1 glycosyltransferase [Streptomyces sp. SID1328]